MADRMRASDAERDETVALLRHAVGEGRLDMEEFTDRTTRAYLAKTRGELLELIGDIPRAQLAPPVQRELPKAPGRAGFTARRIVSGGRALLHAAQAGRRRFEENVAEYFLEEQPLLVRPQAVAGFSAEVAELRDDVERLAKRMERLRGGLA